MLIVGLDLWDDTRKSAATAAGRWRGHFASITRGDALYRRGNRSTALSDRHRPLLDAAKRRRCRSELGAFPSRRLTTRPLVMKKELLRAINYKRTADMYNDEPARLWGEWQNEAGNAVQNRTEHATFWKARARYILSSNVRRRFLTVKTYAELNRMQRVSAFEIY